MKAPKPSLVETTETDITVQFAAVSEAGASYKLQWKQYQLGWETAVSKDITATAGADTVKAVAEPLEPGTTYCVRLLVTVDGQETPSDELVLDTEQVGCTPKAEKGCCVIL